MTSVFDVANWFLSKGSITHKKLQKLCYYSQAWYCALYDGTPLFIERIEAWVHGPVIPELYRIFAAFGWDEIPIYTGELSFTEKEIAVLEAVFNTYWKFSGNDLEELTHREAPWINARGDLSPWEPGTNEITPTALREYYSARYQEAQND